MRYLSLLLLLASCSSKPSSYIEPQLQPYVSSFVVDAETRGIYLTAKRLTIIFDNMDSDNNGWCQTFTHTDWRNHKTTSQLIRIDREHFNSISEPHRLTLVYHEMSHCFLGAGHTIHWNHIMHPAALMYQTDTDIQTNWTRYVDDLFH